MGREKPDFYALKAQREGYPARSVYKLEEIQQKTGLLKKNLRVLDVGSSPGSWSLYTLKLLEGTGFLVGIDLAPVKLKTFPANAFFFQGDLFDESSLNILKDKGPFEVILSDAAPSTTGNRTVDTARSYRLVERVIEVAEQVLVPGGSLLAKIFQGGDEKALLERLNSLFRQTKILRPKAVRDESFETYFLGTSLIRPQVAGVKPPAEL